jgi:hypothetical protein
MNGAQNQNSIVLLFPGVMCAQQIAILIKNKELRIVSSELEWKFIDSILG